MLPEQRRMNNGKIQGYLPICYVIKPIGFPSDDTQLSYSTLEQMIVDQRFVPDKAAGRFCQGRIFGIGYPVKSFFRNHKSGMPYLKCGPKSVGNAVLMCIAPMVIPHLRTGIAELWADTALSAMLTHNDSALIASCLSFVNMLCNILAMDTTPAADWWLEIFVNLAKDLESDYSYRPRGGAYKDYQGTLWKFVEEKISEAHAEGLFVVDACHLWHSGAFLIETVPSVLFTLYSDEIWK